MNPRLQRWNDRYRAGPLEPAPAPLLRQAVEGVRPGVALDLACGSGRNALYLAERGWQVVAVDGAAAGLELLEREAQLRGVGARVRAVEADLETEPPGFAIAAGGYDLICDFYYLHRPLLEGMRWGLRAGGLLCAAIYLVDEGAARPMSADFLLQPSELGALVRGWGFAVVHEEEGRELGGGHERAAVRLIARGPGGQGCW